MVADPLKQPVVRQIYRGDLSKPVGIPEAAIERAIAILRSGRLHRYDETRADGSEVADLECEFAQALGRRYAVALNSGGCALFVALKAAGLEPGETVLTNAFTLAPVPGSIAHAGGQPQFVATTEDLTIDLAHLERRIHETSSRFFMLSHMRGHLADMDAVAALCEAHGVILIEDCAHTWGASWRGAPTGTFGKAGCFSAQSFKHMNAGEGGLLVTDDADLAARAVMLSGSYMFYGKHAAAPPPERFGDIRLDTPNCSMRMTELAAALLRPQLSLIDGWREQWNVRHDRLAVALAKIPQLTIPKRPDAEVYVGSSLQFLLNDLGADRIAKFVEDAAAHGVFLKWFGSAEPVGFTSRYPHWRYAQGQPEMQVSDDILKRVCDMRIPVDLPLEDCDLIAEIVKQSMRAITESRP